MATKTRSTLLTGVSLAAVGILAPTHALAQIVATHAHPDPGVYTGVNTSNDLVVVGGLGGTDTAAVYVCDNADAFCGVVDTSNAVASSLIVQVDSGTSGDLQMILTDVELGAIAGTVSDVATANAAIGWAIDQGYVATTASAVANVALDVNGNALIHALASANNTEGTADAYAEVDGINEWAYGQGDLNADLHVGPATASGTTDASLAFVATAIANGTNLADADANVDFGIYVGVTAVGAGETSGHAGILNDGTLTIGAAAIANADSEAYASAVIGYGIDNEARYSLMDHGEVSIVNNGTMNFSALATADGGTARADGHVNSAMYQLAAGVDDADASLVNAGSIDVNVQADAEAGNKGAWAYADADIDHLLYQDVTSIGSGNALIDNDGTIAAHVSAFAEGSDAQAYAQQSFGLNDALIRQDVEAATAAGTIANSGTISAVFVAEAIGGSYARASADAWGVAVQNIDGGSAASANMTNDGTIAVVADADAIVGTADDLRSGDARADARAWALWQQVDGPVANGTFVNNGVISVHAMADAAADGAITGDVFAGGVYQEVNGSTVAAVMSNNSMIDIYAMMHASGAHAVADASVTAGMSQVAEGTSIDADMVNNGTIQMSAIAEATGSLTTLTGPLTAPVTITYGDASAYAIGSNAFHQYADGSAVDASMVNNGMISLNVDGDAKAAYIAYVEAYGSAIVDQYVNATSGHAVISNAGTIMGSANASAIGSGASAYASIVAIDQYAEGSLLDVSLANGGMIDIAAAAFASATEGYREAVAYATAARQYINGSEVNGAVVNSGTVLVDAMATLNAPDGFAEATAIGLLQYLSASTAAAQMTNAGIVSLEAIAKASGTGVMADAEASDALYQHIDADNASGVMYNSGSVYMHASASANGLDVMAYADANDAMNQLIHGGAAAFASLTNSGSVTAMASAHAVGVGTSEVGTGTTATTITFGNAWAYADAQQGIYQEASAAGTASAFLSNSGGVFASAFADASAGDYAFASADATGIEQEVYSYGSMAVGELYNGGLVWASATANALGGDVARLYADAEGINQNVDGGSGGSASAYLSNSGTVLAIASGHATGTSYVDANAYARGIDQRAFGDLSAVAVMTNSGYIEAAANAFGSHSGSEGYVEAYATGAVQEVGPYWFSSATGDYAMDFANSGTISALATASLVGGGRAFAGGYGYVGRLYDGTFGFDNDGLINVAAQAVATSGGAGAYATGVQINALGTTIDFGTLTGTSDDVVIPATLSGDLVNTGNITVAAVASGVLTSDTTPVLTTSGPGTAIASTLTTYTALSFASAVGVHLDGALVDASVTNSGTIMVDAWTANGDAADVGGLANAYGVLVTGAAEGATPTTETFVFTNDGGMIQSRVSGDGGATFARGFAVDVSDAPNASILNLYGEGDIYGHIHLQDGDTVNVEMGETSFDGLFNPDMELVGDLVIGNGGALFLRDDPHRTDNMYDGPSGGWLDTLTIEADGTIIYELPTWSDAATAEASYSQLFVNTANLDGTLLIRPNSENGLYDDAYFFDNVIKTTNDADASSRNGMFDTCAIDSGITLFLELECIYDTSGNVDLGLERVRFDDFDFDTQNQLSTAGAIECFYGLDL
ncbi:beta strand repeat-containing protein, partial [Sphingomicrobium nitratireducens]|uniref:beta strand repeat-containing protein n=1 Tax=Sphingomicrobium nitratireducens TaxID=2964666 RepID=UPI00223ED719